MKKLILFLVLLFPITVRADTVPIKNFKSMKSSKINSYSAAVLDKESGKILFSKRGNAEKPIASITKIIGAYVFLNNKPNLAKKAVMESKDEVGGGRLRLPVGTSMQAKDFLYSSLIGSANNCATALIRLSGLEKETFIDRMNNLADKAGAKSTKFVDSSGISAQNVSTAEELATIGKEVFDNEQINKICSKEKYSFFINNKKGQKTITHTSSIVSKKGSNYRILGAKTGYLPEVGNNLIVKIKKKTGKGELIITTMGASSQSKASRDAELLTEWAIKNHKWEK